MQYMLPVIIQTARYFLFAGIPFLIFYILFPNVFSKNKIQSRMAKGRDFKREILQSLQTILIFAGVGILILKTPLVAYTKVYSDLAQYSVWWIPISVLLALLLHDAYFYWMHRGVHHPSVFRQVHLVHHQSVNPSPWASYSFHILEGVLEAMIVPLVLILIPMHPIALVIFALVSFMINVYGHLGYEIAPKWFRHSILFEVVNTSTHHNIHHDKFKGNYGLYFRIWDRLMGTEHPDYVQRYDEIQVRRFGDSTQSASTLKGIATFVIVILVLFFAHATMAQSHAIEGDWRYNDRGAIIRIYESEGAYYGQLIDAGNELDNEKLRQHGEVLLLKDFQKTSDTTFCCGTLFAPKRNKTFDASLLLQDDDTLKVHGTYGVLSKSDVLTRI